MADLTSLSALTSSVKTAIDIAKFLKGSDLSFEKAESKLKLADLISSLADAKIEISELEQLLAEKDKKIRLLKDQLSVIDKVVWEAPYYWAGDGTEKDGPYCQNCYDTNKKLIRLQGNGEGFWECKNCNNHYKDSSYKPYKPKLRVSNSGRRNSWMSM